MEIQFKRNTPIKTTRLRPNRTVNIPLDQVQQETFITFSKEARDKYDENDRFTLLMRDPDAPNGEYLHYLVINSDGKDPRDGNTILSYVEPQRVGHRYMYELYKQPDLIDSPVIKNRQKFDIDTFVEDNELEKIASITVMTLKRNPSAESKDEGSKDKELNKNIGNVRGGVVTGVRGVGARGGGVGGTRGGGAGARGGAVGNVRNVANNNRVANKVENNVDDNVENAENEVEEEDVKWHGFVKGIEGPDAKYCTCNIEAEYKMKQSGKQYNPYAVCASSTGGYLKQCGDYYDYERMPLPYLLTFADRHDIDVPDRKSRRSAIDAIYKWKGVEK